MTISLSSVVGVLTTLACIALIGCVGVLIHAEKLLGQCREVLNFAFFIAARNDEEESLESLDEEHERKLIYDRAYSKGYAAGELAGMKRLKQEQDAESYDAD